MAYHQRMFALGTSAWAIAARTAIVYLALLVDFRVAGKRELGQMNPFDLVVIILIANAPQNAMVGPDTSLLGGLTAAGVLLGGNFLVSRARQKILWLSRIVDGKPTLLIRDGQILAGHLRREGIDEADVLMAIREHGLENVADVRMAVLETDGAISIVQMGTPLSRTKRKVRFPNRR